MFLEQTDVVSGTTTPSAGLLLIFLSIIIENNEILSFFEILSTFQLILPMCFQFMRSFVNSTISRVCHRPLFCVKISM